MAAFTSDAVQDTLSAVAAIAREARDPWWLIGSAAMALHGALVPQIGDVDLLMSPRDADALCARLGLERADPTSSDRFRSEVFAHWREHPLEVDVMGGFAVLSEGRWQAVRPRTREAFGLDDGGVLYAPIVGELIAICQLFGRPKDLERVKLLETLLD